MQAADAATGPLSGDPGQSARLAKRKELRHMSQFIKEDTGSSRIDWLLLSAGVLALVATIVTDVYAGAMIVAG